MKSPTLKPMTPELLKRFLKLAGDRLSGDWIIIGGTVLPLLGIDHRTTTDIDIAPADSENMKETLELMKIAEDLNLPIESINQAASYFLHKIKLFQNHLILMHRGKHASIFRPDLELFFQLKLQRFSESDLADCLEYFAYAKKNNETIRSDQLLRSIDKEIKKNPHAEKQKRLETLKAQIIK